MKRRFPSGWVIAVVGRAARSARPRIDLLIVLVVAGSVCAGDSTFGPWPDVAPEPRLWNTFPLDQVVHRTWTGPAKALEPIRIVTPIGGVGTGQIVATQAGGVKELALAVKPPEGWPADSVTARFQSMADETTRQWHWGPGESRHSVKLHDIPVYLPSYLARLTDTAPNAPVVPIRVIAAAPRTARAGVATATLTVAWGGKKQDIAVRIECGPFVMPEPGKALAHVDIYQSPEAVARQYRVPLWSQNHWAFVERSLKLIGQFPSHVAWVPLKASGMDGVTESMLRYRSQGVTWAVDATALERYLELYAQHCGEPTSLACFVWGGDKSDVHPRRGTEADLARTEFVVTGLDGRPITVKGFTLEAQSLYKAAFDAVRAAVRKRGWSQNCIHIGLAMDCVPSKFFTDFIGEPSGNAAWIRHAHDQQRDFNGVPVAFAASARSQADWNGPFWTNPRQIVGYPYDEGPSSGLLAMYQTVNGSLGRHLRGIAGPMADFWSGCLWVGGQPTMRNYGQYIFQPGPLGAEHSVQSLILLEAGQAAEAAWRCAAAGDKAADAWLGWGRRGAPRADWVGQEKAMEPERLPDLEAALFRAAAGK